MLAREIITEILVGLVWQSKENRPSEGEGSLVFLLCFPAPFPNS